MKPNAEEKETKPRGAKLVHKGSGRSSHQDGEADRTVEINATMTQPAHHQGIRAIQDIFRKTRIVCITGPKTERYQRTITLLSEICGHQ